MRFLVFGKSGQVARELERLTSEARFLSRAEADLAEAGACERAIRTERPQAVINTAAWTNVDGAEDQVDTAMRINAGAPGEMAAACAGLGIPLVHISTDYVFDGTGDAPFPPDALTGPLGAYGATKLAGEEAIRATGTTHAILRTSWVFSAHGANFLKTMLRLSESRDHLRVVADQVGGPTPASAIAQACLTIAGALIDDPASGGTYHFSGAPDASWADFARAIFEAADRDVRVEGIPSTEYPTKAVRPLNSRLDCRSTEAVFGISRPDWRAALEPVVAELASA